tara:strand:- start:6000 stop:8393 length:2394 start_codon:yes stop_codon:yes gene_type:complete
MAGYTRTDTANNIANGNVINANDLDAEYNAVEASFNASSGHKHDGTAAEGAPITKVGPSQDLIVSSSSVLPKTPNTLDLGSVGVQFKNGYFDGVLYADSSVHGVNGLSSIGDNVYTVSSGGLSVDVDGDITLNPTGLDVVLASAGTPYGSLTNTSSNLTIKSGTTTAITLTGANTALAGTLDVTGAITGALTGNAATASKLATSRSITLQGDLTGVINFDGSANVTATVGVSDDSHNHTQANVDGLVAALASINSTNSSQATSISSLNTSVNGKVATTRNITAGAGLTGGGNLTADRTISHSDTSTQASVNNSGTTFIQDITLDTYGHITSIGSASVPAQYSLPTASSSTLGGIKIGSGLSISSGVVSAAGFADANYFNYGGTGGSAAVATTDAISIGEDAEALSEVSVAIGYNATTVLNSSQYRPGSIAIGMNTLTTGESSISIGSNAAGNGGSATSIGYNSNATGNGATAIGAYTQALGIRSVAIGGHGQDPTSSNTLSGPTASNNSCIAIGDATAIGEYSIAIGGTARGASNTSSGGLSSIAIGKFAIISTNAFGGVAIGQQTSCGYNSVSQIGNVAVGSGAKARNSGSTSVGYNSDCVSGSGGSGVNNVALGKQATVSGSSNTGNSVALGYAAAVTTSNTIRLGNTSISSLLCQDTTISTSDVRDKTDFEALNYGLDFVKAIPTYKYKRNNRGEYYTLSPELDEDENRVYTYDEDGYNNETKKLDRVDFGFKAQEVEALIQSNERLVSTTTEPEGFELKSFAHSDMVPILWKAVQELSAKNDALEARIVALES